MSNDYWCPNPSQWLDITIQFRLPPPQQYAFCGFACCSQCWAGPECVIRTWRLEEMAQPDFLETLLEEWNAERFRALRRQWHEAPPDMCDACPRLAEGVTPPVLRSEIFRDATWQRLVHDQAVETYPRVLSLNYDPSCSLKCPSCRTETVQWKAGDRRFEWLHQFQERTIRPLLKRAQWVHACGYGDPFSSELYRNLLTTLQPAEAPDVQFCFLTNGLGFTRLFFDSMPCRDRISSMSVSIDAATPETYSLVRGGNWQKLQRNLRLMSTLREAGTIKQFELGFVFQRANWREIPAFFKMARKLGADRAILYSLLDQGHYEYGAYALDAVHLPTSPDHEEAMRMVQWARTQTDIQAYVEVPNPKRAGLGPVLAAESEAS